MKQTYTDATLTSLIAKFGISASDYYDALAYVDASEPMRYNSIKQCRDAMDDSMACVLDYVEKAYIPRGYDAE